MLVNSAILISSNIYFLFFILQLFAEFIPIKNELHQYQLYTLFSSNIIAKALIVALLLIIQLYLFIIRPLKAVLYIIINE